MENPSLILTYDPRTGKELARYPAHSSEQISAILRETQQEFSLWRSLPLGERISVIQRLSGTLAKKKTALMQLMQSEMGKSPKEGEAEIDKCIACAEYYAREGERLLQKIPVNTEARKSFVSFEPLGPVLAIMPWNFPFWQAIRCAIPSVLAGNTVLLKHASNVTGCSLALEQIFFEASGRTSLFRSILVSGKAVLPLIARSEVAAVSLTGSTEVGRQVASAAGHALKKCVLELGGSDAYIVLADADLDTAAKICAQSRLINAGQSCIAAKRFVVEKSISQEFSERFVEAIQEPALAPLARSDLRAQLHAQVEKSVQQGGRLLCGGKIPVGEGYYYPATVLANVRPGNTAFDEELFGPVAALVEAKDQKEAIALANQSEFGLGAAVFTRDPEKAEHIAKQELQAGSCFANALVRSDPRLPFGGIKDSGFGRELSEFGLREFTNIKTVYLA